MYLSLKELKAVKANYKVQDIKIDNTQNRLQLITCYPFDTINSGGSLRYVVFANKIDN